MLGPDTIQVYFASIGRKIVGKRNARGGETVIGRGKAGRVCGGGIIAFPLCDVHDLDLNRAFGTSPDARGLASFRQTVVAHIAFADDSALRVVLRNSVGTIPGAVLAADTGFRVVNHYSGDGILRIRVNRTTCETRRLETMIAAHRKMEALRIWIPPAFNFADPPPVNISWISILFIACDDATFAADALGHVEVKAVLLAGRQRSLWDSCRRTLVHGRGAMSRSAGMYVIPASQGESCALLFRSFDERQLHLHPVAPDCL
jgi:hypothetical protein